MHLNAMPPIPPLRHSLPGSPVAPQASYLEDQVAGIFRGINKSHESETQGQWPQVLLSKLSGDLESSNEERRELPPGEQLLVRSNPVANSSV